MSTVLALHSSHEEDSAIFKRMGYGIYHLNTSSPDVQRAMAGDGLYPLRDINPVCVLFNGGADVSPDYYGATPEPQTRSNKYRDKLELRIFDLFYNAVPMFGICRGAQFLHVVMEGELCQHIPGNSHCGSHHNVHTEEGDFAVNSFHHQMIIPQPTVEVVAEAVPHLSELDVPEVEAIKYAPERIFGVQWHPEWMPVNSAGYQFFVDNVQEMLK